MLDTRLHWEDFKKCIKEYALAWNFREWINTTVFGGAMWRKVVDKTGVKIKEEKQDEGKAVGGEMDPAVAKF